MKKIHLFDIVSNDGNHPIYFEIDGLKKLEGKFKVRHVGELSAKYHPETITYTGVTVGNFHVGGFEKNEAYYTTSSKSTDRGELHYLYNDSTYMGWTVNSIVFSKELKKIALKEIGHLFNQPEKNGFNLYKGSSIAFASEVLSGLRTGNQITLANAHNSNLSSYSKYDTCVKVGEFLFKAIHGDFLTSEQKCEAAKILLAKDDFQSWISADNILKNPTNSTEKELAQKVQEKLDTIKLYKVGKYIYNDKSNYLKGLFIYIMKKLTIPSLIASFVFTMILSNLSDNFLLYFWLGIGIFVIWFALRLLAYYLEPQENTYYEIN